MKHSYDFDADRVAAQHCEELLARAAPKFDRAEAAQSMFESFCADLSERLRAHLLGARPTVSGEPGTSQTGDALMRSIGRKAANFAVSATEGGPILLVSFGLDHAARLTDRLFGGDGAELEQVPEALALSSTLALERIAGAALSSFRCVSGIPESPAKMTHDIDIARVAPFERAAYCFSWEIKISQDEFGPWITNLAVLESELDALLQSSTSSAKPSITSETSSAIYGEIPLSASAVLAQTKLPLDRLANLKPGDILPFSPSRSVPLFLDDACIAEGRMGSLDERIALQITKVHLGGTRP